MAVKIYTKTGDQGETRLVDGQKVLKNNPRVETYGSLDELNSHLGLCRSLCQNHLEQVPHLMLLDQALFRIQNHLFNMGSSLACDSEIFRKKLKTIESSHIEFLESTIDKISADLPELKNFILPGGQLLACQLHVARTICRRAERSLIFLKSSWPEGKQDSDFAVNLIYVNRLSDLLFVAARFVQQQFHANDIHWDNQA